eukprot:1149222-Pelagomonas_calceolata.AAC.2
MMHAYIAAPSRKSLCMLLHTGRHLGSKGWKKPNQSLEQTLLFGSEPNVELIAAVPDCLANTQQLLVPGMGHLCLY